MKKFSLCMILWGLPSAISGQQPPTQQQAIQETLEQLVLIRNELAKPVGPNNTAQPHLAPPNQGAIQATKLRLQGAHFDRLASKIFEARDSTRMPRITQEAIAHVAVATAAAQNSALQERFIQKNINLTNAQSKREETERELEALQEIKRLQEHEKQVTAHFKHACTDLELLREVKKLDIKLSELSNHLCTQELQLTREIMALQETVRELKQSPSPH